MELSWLYYVLKKFRDSRQKEETTQIIKLSFQKIIGRKGKNYVEFTNPFKLERNSESWRKAYKNIYYFISYIDILPF